MKDDISTLHIIFLLVLEDTKKHTQLLGEKKKKAQINSKKKEKNDLQYRILMTFRLPLFFFLLFQHEK